MLEKLKQLGGPFTKAEEVDEFLLNAKSKASSKRYNKLSKKLWNDVGKRMKLEMQFARNSSINLPQTDPIFRIQVSLPNKKRRDKTPDEFGVSLKALLGKRSGKAPMSLEIFKKSLYNVCATV